MKTVPILIGLPEYSQIEEDSLAVELEGRTANLTPIIYNTTLGKERSWNGTVFINAPLISPTIIPLASETFPGLVSPTGAPTGKYLKDDLTWEVIAGGGDVVGPTVSVANQLALFDGITGKLIKADTTTGIVKSTAGVISAAVADTDYSLPATVNAALALKAPLANPVFTGTFAVPAGAIANAALANSAVANLSGTNSGDNATNSQYSGFAASKQDVLTGLTSTVAELNYTDGVTSAIQGQLDAKLDDTQFSGLTKISVGTSTPSSPSIGDLWVDTSP